MAHHDLCSGAAQAVRDVRVHEHVDGTVGVRRVAHRGGHRGDAGVRPGLGTERRVEVGRAGGHLHHDGRRTSPAGPVCTTSMPRSARRAAAPASSCGPSTIASTRARPRHGQSTAQPQRKAAPGAGRASKPAMPSPSPSGTNLTTTSLRAGCSSNPRSCQVSSADAAPRAVRADSAHLVDVARVDGREVERADVGRDARQQLVRVRHARGRQPAPAPARHVPRRPRRTRPARPPPQPGSHAAPRRAEAGATSCRPSLRQDDDQDEHEEQRKAGRPQQWATGLRGVRVSQDGPRRRTASSRGRRRRRRCRGWRRGRSCRCRCTCRRG